MTTRVTVGALVDVSCYTCGVGYAIPDIINQAALDKPRNREIYCPNGHKWWYIGETDAQKLKRQLEWERDRRASIASERDQAQASLRATRGVVTKLRKRVVAGACPFGCRRHFANLERHVAVRHSGQQLEGESA